MKLRRASTNGPEPAERGISNLKLKRDISGVFSRPGHPGTVFPSFQIWLIGHLKPGRTKGRLESSDSEKD